MGEKGQAMGPDGIEKAIIERNELLDRTLKGNDCVQAGEYDLKIDIFHETYEPAIRSTGWHAHERWHELSLMRTGSMEYKIKDKLVVVEAARGDIVFIPAGMKHCRSCVEPGAVISGFQFSVGSAKLGSPGVERFDNAIEAAGFHSEGSEETAWTFEDLKTELEGQRPLRSMRLGLLIKELLAHMLRKAIPGAFRAESARSSEQDMSGQLARRLEAYIEENLSRDISLQELGSVCGISARHANRIFVKRFGMPLGRHMTLLRMKTAKSELESGDRQVKEIAGTLGYHDASHFIRMFKRVYGITPQECRKTANA